MTPPRFRTIAFTLVCAMSFVTWVEPTGRADELLIEDMRLANIEIIDVSEGEITYLLGAVQRKRSIESSVLTLTDVPQLARAEQAWAQNKPDEAIVAWKQAADEAAKDWQQAWVLYRLSIALDSAGRFTESASTWARLIMTQPDSYWALAAPVGQPDHPADALKADALKSLKRADAEVQNTRLRPLIAELIATVETLTQATPATKPEKSDEVSTSERKQGERPAVPDATTDEGTKQPDVGVHMPDAVTPGTWQNVMETALIAACAPAPVNPVSQRVRTFVRQSQWVQAMSELESLAANPGTYPLDRLLFEYGWALSETGQPRAASMRLLQCAILFESSQYAYWSLIRCAWVYRFQFGDSGTADLLLRMAIDQTGADEEAPVPGLEQVAGLRLPSSPRP